MKSGLDEICMCQMETLQGIELKGEGTEQDQDNVFCNLQSQGSIGSGRQKVAECLVYGECRLDFIHEAGILDDFNLEGNGFIQFVF